MIDYLMEKGCEKQLHLLDAQKHSPRMLAVQEKRKENVEHLLTKYHADPNQMGDTRFCC